VKVESNIAPIQAVLMPRSSNYGSRAN